jgi:hypothetical protein
MLAYTEVKLDSIIAHRIGRKTEHEGLILSKGLMPMPDDDLLHHLCQYFFSSFKEPMFYLFKPVADELMQNPLYQWARQIFSDPSQLESISKEIADFLYTHSTHANIKSGDLFISYFHDMLVDDELLSGLVICKAETKDTFLQVDQNDGLWHINSLDGINIKSVDKACLIFDTEAEDGYKLCIIDKSNNSEARFWMEDFLQVAPRTDDYFNTKNYIQLTKSFVKDRMQPLYETDKVDEVEVMNRSQNFFTATENFDETTYADQVFQRKEMASDFLEYRRDYEQEKGVELNDRFDISQDAVKNQSRVFKSVLKLDKNFHIYIHGDRNLIQKGVDEQGRKFYKVFYEREA